MANRTFNEVSYSLIKRLVTLCPVVNIGAAGAVTLQKRQFTAAGSGSVAPAYSLVAAPTTGVGYAVGDGGGVKSVARTGTGAWTITLSDSYRFLVQISVGFQNAGATFNAPVMVTNTTGTDVTLNTAVGTGGVIKIQFYNGAGVATDPGNPDQAQFAILLGDATEP